MLECSLICSIWLEFLMDSIERLQSALQFLLTGPHGSFNKNIFNTKIYLNSRCYRVLLHGNNDCSNIFFLVNEFLLILKTLAKIVVQTPVFRLDPWNWLKEIYLLQKLDLKNGVRSSNLEFPCILIRFVAEEIKLKQRIWLCVAFKWFRIISKAIS